MPFYRNKHSFSAGELSPLLWDRDDFSKHKNGCVKIRNMVVTTQGPITRRPGFEFIYDLNSIGLDVNDPQVRLIPFIFNEDQAYAMIFYMSTGGIPRIVFGDKDGLLVYPDPLPVCPEIQVYGAAYAGPAQHDFIYDLRDNNPLYYTVYYIPTTGTPGGDEPIELVAGTDYSIIYGTNGPPATPNELYITYDDPVGGPYAGSIQVWAVPSLGTAVPGDIVSLALPGIWDIEEFDWAQSGDEMYCTHSAMSPKTIKRHSNYCWELITPGFTNQPAEWSDVNGWPERVTFHQQRLVYGANLLRRQTIWMSKAGSFLDFGVSGTIVSSDAITFTLDSGTQNKIRWLSSAKSLHVGTVGDEWTVTGATTTAITPANVLAQRQTNDGSEALKPLMIGITTMFLERHGLNVKEFVYDYTYDSYKTTDISILSNHVTRYGPIIDWSYQQAPHNIIWTVLAGGTLAGITYEREHEIIAWHLHTTQGAFKAITSVPGDNYEDEVWVIVRRIIEDTTKYYVEKLSEYFKPDIPGVLVYNPEYHTKLQFLDSAVQYDGEPTSKVSGLDHLEGALVDVLSDGATHPQLQVYNGEVELNAQYSNIKVGLGYSSEVWPTLTDAVDTLGSSYGRNQRITSVAIDFYETVGAYIAKWSSDIGETSEVIPFRDPKDPTGRSLGLYSGIKKITFTEGFAKRSNYYIYQRDPLPMTVRSVTDEIEVQA